MSAKIWMPLLALAALVPGAARAHCDTLDGPVAVAARGALESGEPGPALAWVRPADEAEIRGALARARAVRAGGREARELADRWFLETLVRVHRAGEGAPFTGLKPAGEVEPAVAAADRAIAAGDPRALEALLQGAVREGLHARWARLLAERPPGRDAAAGRRWVAAYVPLVHWAEAVHAAAGHGGGHGDPTGAHGEAGEGGHGERPGAAPHAAGSASGPAHRH